MSVTNGYEPSECPFCTPSRKPAKVLDAAWVVLVKKPGAEPDYMQTDAGVTLMDEARAKRWANTTVGETTFEAREVQTS